MQLDDTRLQDSEVAHDVKINKKIVKDEDFEGENRRDEDLMYDLAGFDNSKTGAAESESRNDYLYNLIERTLSRYNCTNVNPATVHSLLSVSELQKLKKCDCLYLGSYPLPPSM